jgi:hypothetical protein
MIEHNYTKIDGWFDMENQYLELLERTPEGGIFVELGAWMGKSTSFIVTEIINRSRDVRFYTIDNFVGTLTSSDENENKAYREHKLSEILMQYGANTFHLQDYYTTMVGESSKMAERFKDRCIDAIFIDAGHSYESVIADLNAWYPKMNNNSIMAGHDYNKWPGVNRAVNEFFDSLDKVENECWFKTIKK